jgi:hypothetical protein
MSYHVLIILTVLNKRGWRHKGSHGSHDRSFIFFTENGSNTAEALLAKDVAHGFSIPVSPSTVEKIKG